MSFIRSNHFKKNYRKLDKKIQNKVDKALLLLASNLRHPSLEMKKMPHTSWYEVMVDIHYRMRLSMEDGDFILFSVGMHDSVLGKK